MTENTLRLLTPAALVFAALTLGLGNAPWHAWLVSDGLTDTAAWLDLLFPVCLGLMFGLTLLPKYVKGYTVFLLGLTGSLLLYPKVLGMKNDGFGVLYAVTLMVTVQTAVMAWRYRRSPGKG